jgi:hypothetical protein
MIKLIDLIETKIVPNKREFRVTAKSPYDVFVGDLTIGSLTTKYNMSGDIPSWVGVSLHPWWDEIRVTFNNDEAKGIFENNLKTHGIKYKLDEQYGVTFSIPIKENNIKIIDNIGETKVTPIRKIPAIYDTEYDLIYINNWEYNGIEYGGKEYENGVYFHFYLDNEQNRYNHFINKLKERRIPYKIEEDPELFTSVLIDIKYFDIPNRIKETKIAPKKPFTLYYTINNPTEDKMYYLFIDNILSNENLVDSFTEDELKDLYIEIKFNRAERKFQGSRLSVGSDYYNYIKKKIKGLSGVQVEKVYTSSYDNGDFIIMFKIPIKYFEMKELNTDDLDETKVAPKSNKEFRVTEKRDDYINGNLTIGIYTHWAYMYEDDNDMIIVIFHYEGNENEISKFENNLRKNNIKYTDTEQDNELEDEYIYYFIPIKENNIKVVDNIGETKIAPRKPFILFRSIRTINQWIDESYHFFKNNDPKQDTIWVFSKDEIEEPYLSLQFTETSINISRIIYLYKKIKNLSGAKVETQEVDYKRKIKSIFSIPTKYFEIQEYPKQQ